MLNRANGHSINITKKNSNVIKKFKLPIPNNNSQSRNSKNTSNNEKNLGKCSLYSTKDATPRKEYNPVAMPSSIQNTYTKPSKDKNDKIDLDDSLSQISKLLDSDKKDLNYSGLIGKIPGINEEENFVYDQLLFNKSRINKAKILSHKIGVLKLPISKISTKEALTNSDREKKCFSDRVQGSGNLTEKNKSNDDDKVGFSCCFFRKK